MASEKELRLQSKAVLFDLLMIRHAIKTGKGEQSIEEVIDRNVAFMDDEDVASVQLKVKDKLEK